MYTEKVQVVEIVPHGKQGPFCHAYIQCHDFWCPGDARGQAINSHGIDLVFLLYMYIYIYIYISAPEGLIAIM